MVTEASSSSSRADDMAVLQALMNGGDSSVRSAFNHDAFIGNTRREEVTASRFARDSAAALKHSVSNSRSATSGSAASRTGLTSTMLLEKIKKRKLEAEAVAAADAIRAHAESPGAGTLVSS